MLLPAGGAASDTVSKRAAFPPDSDVDREDLEPGEGRRREEASKILRHLGDPGLVGRTITLTGTSSTTATTEAGGAFSFSGLTVGSYTATFALPTGWANTGGTGDPSAARTIAIGDGSVAAATFTVRPTMSSMRRSSS